MSNQLKQITVNQPTLEAITKHGATSMLWVIDEKVTKIGNGRIEWETQSEDYDWTHDQPIEDFIRAYSPLQLDDEFKLVEEVTLINTDDEKAYRYLGFKGKVLSVEVRYVQALSYVEVQDLNGDYGFSTKEQFYDWLKTQNIDYNANKLVGLINFKEKE